MSNDENNPEEKAPTTGERIREAMLPSGPKPVAEPEKELRFTRNRQAIHFFVLAGILFGAGTTFIATSLAPEAPYLIWIWSLPLYIVAFLLFRTAIHCTRHAYIILTPLGVEIFPFFKARENLQVIYWSQIANAEVEKENTLLTLDFNEEQTSGIKASLKPISVEQRVLLKSAMENTIKNKKLNSS